MMRKEICAIPWLMWILRSRAGWHWEYDFCYQVLTPRDLIRVIRLYAYYRSLPLEPLSHQEALRRAVQAVLYGMWHETSAREYAGKILRSRGMFDESLSSEQILRDAARAGLGHLLIFMSSTGNPLPVLTSSLPQDSVFYFMNMGEAIALKDMTAGVSVDLSGRLGEYPGTLVKAIQEAWSHPEKKHVLVLDNFQQTDADTAVGLNRGMQDGLLEVPETMARKLAGARQGRFVRIPENLLVAALMHTPSEPTNDDKLPMSGAELSRFTVVNMAEEMSEEWVERFVTGRLKEAGLRDAVILAEAARRGREVYRRAQKAAGDGYYDHVRLSRYDFEEYADELIARRDEIGKPDVPGRVASYTLGIGLRDNGRSKIKNHGPPSLEYVERAVPGAGGKVVDLRIGDVVHPTAFDSKKEAEQSIQFALIPEQLEAMEAMLAGFRQTRDLVLLEGPPGGGKTEIAEMLARLLGWDFGKTEMFKGRDITDFLGHIEQTAPGQFRLTVSRGEDGRILTDFLNFVERGGVYCLDEVNISRPSVHVTTFFERLFGAGEIDLGLYHGGIEIGHHVIRRHPKFKLVVTYNPAGQTYGRLKMPLAVEWLGKKIWVTDHWSDESFLLFIDYYLSDPAALTLSQKKALVRLHRNIKHLLEEEFRNGTNGEGILKAVLAFQPHPQTGLYTYQYGVSPRELIGVAKTINDGGGIFEGIMFNYLYQFSRYDFAAVAGIIEEVLPGFKAFTADWGRGAVVLGRNGEGVTVEQGDNAGPGGFFVAAGTGMQALLSLDKSLRPRQHVMIVAEAGSYPLELMRFYAGRMGIDLHVFNADSYTGAVELLGGPSVKFAGFNDAGVAESENGVGTVLGFLGRHLVRRDQSAAQTNGRSNNAAVRKILYLSSLEMMAPEELDVLSNFLNKDVVRIGGMEYVLPQDTRLVVEAGALRQKKFSEPFYNRFRKINLAGVIAPEEVNAYLDIY